MDWILNTSTRSEEAIFFPLDFTKNTEVLDTSNFSDLDKDLMPLLAQVMTLRPLNDHHPNFIRLCKWLSRPQLGVDVFLYVVGPLQERVMRLLEDYKYRNQGQALQDFCDIVGWQSHVDIPEIFAKYTEDGAVYVLKAAAEAMAVRRPYMYWRVSGRRLPGAYFGSSLNGTT